MKTVLIKNIAHLVTMDAARREIEDAAILVRGRAIDAVGAAADLANTRADETIDASGPVSSLTAVE